MFYPIHPCYNFSIIRRHSRPVPRVLAAVGRGAGVLLHAARVVRRGARRRHAAARARRALGAAEAAVRP